MCSKHSVHVDAALVIPKTSFTQSRHFWIIVNSFIDRPFTYFARTVYQSIHPSQHLLSKSLQFGNHYTILHTWPWPPYVVWEIRCILTDLLSLLILLFRSSLLCLDHPRCIWVLHKLNLNTTRLYPVRDRHALIELNGQLKNIQHQIVTLRTLWKALKCRVVTL